MAPIIRNNPRNLRPKRKNPTTGCYAYLLRVDEAEAERIERAYALVRGSGPGRIGKNEFLVALLATGMDAWAGLPLQWGDDR